jgi:hypothetical protein
MTECARSGTKMAVGLDIKRFILMRWGIAVSACPIIEQLEPLRRDTELDRETDGVVWTARFDKAARDKNNEELELDKGLLLEMATEDAEEDATWEGFLAKPAIFVVVFE